MNLGLKKTPGEWSEDITQQRRDGTKALLEQLRRVPFACFADLPLSVSRKAGLVQYFV